MLFVFSHFKSNRCAQKLIPDLISLCRQQGVRQIDTHLNAYPFCMPAKCPFRLTLMPQQLNSMSSVLFDTTTVAHKHKLKYSPQNILCNGLTCAHAEHENRIYCLSASYTLARRCIWKSNGLLLSLLRAPAHYDSNIIPNKFVIKMRRLFREINVRFCYCARTHTDRQTPFNFFHYA